MNTEQGSITIWALGLSMLLFGTGFLALDLWSAFATRSELAAIADSAAIAGGSAIDETAWRNGTLQLQPDEAAHRAETAARTHPRWTDDMTFTIEATTSDIEVTITQTVPFRFLAALVGDQAANIAISAQVAPGERP